MTEPDYNAPPVPDDCDLRHMKWLPIEWSLITDSRALATLTADEWQINMLMIARSWQQVPAASLPENIAQIAIEIGKNSEKNRQKIQKILGNFPEMWRHYGNRYYCQPLTKQAASYWKERQKRNCAAQQYRAEKSPRDGHVTAQNRIEQNRVEYIGKETTLKSVKESQPAEQVCDEESSLDIHAQQVQDDDVAPQIGHTPPWEGGDLVTESDLEVAGVKPAKRIVAQKNPRPTKRGTRLPDGWQPSETDYQFAEQEGFNHDEISRIAATFADHWRQESTQKAVKLDWVATWRNWIRRERDNRNRRNKPAHATSYPSAADRVSERINQRRNEVNDALSFFRGVAN